MNLHSLIQARGLKHKWVAYLIGVSPSRFSRIVHGKSPLPIEKVRPLAIALSVTRAEIIEAALDERV
jgi:plasmid maintenance system antidote protein VapI